MPVYEYQCKACGREFEYQQRMSDPDKTECEACGASSLERLISRTAFSLKGGGWYKDLYASAKPEASGAKTSDASGGTASAAPAKSADSGASSSGGASTGTGGSSGTSGSSGSSGGTSGGGSSTSAAAGKAT